MECWLAMDLGGTNVRLALVRDGQVLESRRFPTQSQAGLTDLLERLAAGVNQLAALARERGLEPRGLGVASPGVIDRPARVVRFSPNLTGWHDVPLAAELEARTGLAVALENDANLYALGEYCFGAGGGRRDLACLTLGTGVGGGLIVNGRLVVGALGCGGELGHLPLYPGGRLCGCGALGCLEAYASATALAGMLAEALAAGRASSLTTQASAEKMAQAAGQGDALARELFATAGEALGRGMAAIVAFAGLDLIVLGGGMTPAWPLMEKAARQALSETLRMVDPAAVSIEIAKLGQQAPLLGAAAWAAHSQQTS